MKRIRMAAALLLLTGFCHAQAPAGVRYLNPAAYPEQDTSAVWRSLGASYVRKALKNNTVVRDPVWNARIDTVMATVGAAAAKLFPTYDGSSWTALLIDGFGHGAVAFPGGTVLVDAGFVRRLDLTDDEVALLLAHEVAHLAAGHPSEKLSFMAETLGKDRAPTAGTALFAFYAQDSYAYLFQPTARLQEREADAIGAAILTVSGYDALRALALFDKLAKIEPDGSDASSHDLAAIRKQAVMRVLEGLPGPTPRAAN